MGYTTKDIAVIFEPKRVSLAALPNFVQFASKARAQVPYEATIRINAFAVEWTPGKFYNFNGDVVDFPDVNTRISGPIDVSAYQGDPYHIFGYCPGIAYCVGFNAAGAKVLTLQLDGVNPVAANFPADITTLYLTNVFTPTTTPTLTLDDSGVDLLSREWAAATVLNIVEPSGAVHSFHGTEDRALVGGSTYFVAGDPSDTAENLRQALLADPWVEANFDVKIPFVWDGENLHNGRTLALVSNGYGAEFNIQLLAPGNAGNTAYTIVLVHGTSQNGDSISGEATTAEISLDVYVDAPIFLGADDKPTSAAMLGTFAVSLSKTYSGDTLWFDLNSPFSKYGAYNLPPDVPGWFNTGTLRVFRFVARVAAVNNFAFYQSNALYVLRGYGAASDPIDLEDYVYDVEKIKLLTNKPRTIYVRGQREYLNFMFSDEDHGKPYAPDWTVKVVYRAYSTTDKFLGEGFSDQIKRSDLNMVNTCILRIDDVLDQFPTAGIVRVALARGNAIISSDLEYTIRPAALHTLNQFSFLNRLGGWDSFNFDASASEDIKVTFDTFSKTVTPGYVKGEGVETVYASDLDAVQTVVGAPVTDEVAEWLKELAASTVVLDSDGKQIIKTEFTATLAEGATNMQVPTMKWRPSETYNNE